MDVGVKIWEILREYEQDISREVEEAERETAIDTVDELQRTSPKRTGNYARGWSYQKTRGGYTVYNTEYRLTHLLENGHAVVSHGKSTGKRAEAKPHIKPAEENAIRKFEKLVRDKINDI